ncbi:hypothetical protein AVEN_162783-1, partial [Araneus ventricosus]
IEEVDSLSVLPIDVTPNEVELNIGPDVTNIFKDKPRRLPFSEKKIIQTQVAEWLEQGVVEPCSSEYSSLVVIVGKKDGTPRVCIDYRRLNKTKSREDHIQLRPLYPDKSEKRKEGGLLHPLQKEDTPLHTYHIDHLGPLESTNKNYKYVLAIIDAFTKFVWIYPTKSTTSAEVIAKLEIQKAVFGSPFQIISDRGTAFTSGDFADYCAKEEIKHHAITTGLPRTNGQIERINQATISVLSKLSL